jgi:hypothetical protein
MRHRLRPAVAARVVGRVRCRPNVAERFLSVAATGCRSEAERTDDG